MAEPAQLSYAAVGVTRPAESSWTERPAGFRRFEQTVRLGQGDADWDRAAAGILAWAVKTRSGFDVASVPPGTEEARVGADYSLVASVGPFRVHEPVRVVAVADEPDRRGFAYGTLEGHPVSGEEAFVVHRDAAGGVWLTLRSLTRPGSGVWRLAFPGVLVAQRVYRRRYLRALR